MRFQILVAGFAVGSTTLTHAEPTAQELTTTARSLAIAGRCDLVPSFAARVKALDAGYYTSGFAADPALAGCGPIHIESAPADELGAPVAAKNELTGLILSGVPTIVGGFALVLASDQPHGSEIKKVGIGAGIAAMAIGPSLGQIYAHNTWNVWFGIRAASIGAFGLVLLQASSNSSGLHGWDSIGELILAGVICGAGAAVGTVGEIITAPRAVERYNRTHRVGQWSVAPVSVAPLGIGLAGRF